jgi:APA family basic amino acid/polyamine antiporter
MIGSGIFIVSSDMVRQLGSAGWLIAMWVLTGTITVIAAVSYGELSAMFPKQVDNIFILEAYGKLVGFYTVGVSLP